MKKHRGRHESEVVLTPLIDVVFLLLIFFMVSTTFVRETELKIELPEADGTANEVERLSIEILIDKQGDIAVDGSVLVNTDKRTITRALNEILLRPDMKAQVDRYGELPTAIVRGDAAARLDLVVRSMDAAGDVGLINVSIATQQPQTES